MENMCLFFMNQAILFWNYESYASFDKTFVSDVLVVI